MMYEKLFLAYVGLETVFRYNINTCKEKINKGKNMKPSEIKTLITSITFILAVILYLLFK